MLTRAVNGVVALGSLAAALVAFLGGQEAAAAGLGVLCLVALVGVAWPKFSAVELVLRV